MTRVVGEPDEADGVVFAAPEKATADAGGVLRAALLDVHLRLQNRQITRAQADGAMKRLREAADDREALRALLGDGAEGGGG
jgi:hypothetical protein